jgi:hypothetical protein
MVVVDAQFIANYIAWRRIAKNGRDFVMLAVTPCTRGLRTGPAPVSLGKTGRQVLTE